jgi:hypothetical protein
MSKLSVTQFALIRGYAECSDGVGCRTFAMSVIVDNLCRLSLALFYAQCFCLSRAAEPLAAASRRNRKSIPSE